MATVVETKMDILQYQELFNMLKEQQIELTGVNTKQQLEELNKMLRESK